MAHSTYEKLVKAAAVMFHKKGYSAASISEILTLAGVPRGSLYHHFPGGKQDLALAAAWQSADRVLLLIKNSFETARAHGEEFVEVIRRICSFFATKFESQERWDYSPVSGMLLDPGLGPEFKQVANEIYAVWRAHFIEEAASFGVREEQAALVGRKLMIMLEGAWVVSRATDKAEPFHQAAAFMIPGTHAILSGKPA